MTSKKKAGANRQNALKSTGPKTPEGKAAVRHNALTHGLLSRQTLLPDEEKAVLVEFSERLRSQLQPVGDLEALLVDRIVAAAWRLRRVLPVEAAIYDEERVDYGGKERSLGWAFSRNATGQNAFSKLSRYESAIERGLYRALHELQRLQAARAAAGSVPPPVAVWMYMSSGSLRATAESLALFRKNGELQLRATQKRLATRDV
jgi:hypothetical protein